MDVPAAIFEAGDAVERNDRTTVTAHIWPVAEFLVEPELEVELVTLTDFPSLDR